MDGYENLTARLGIRAPNLSSDGTYFPSFTSRNRTLVEFAYRSSWLIGAAVDTIADDMTKKASASPRRSRLRQEAGWKGAGKHWGSGMHLTIPSSGRGSMAGQSVSF
ncbi:hypothetical protein SODG_002886 [Sodalis praecaptivus]